MTEADENHDGMIDFNEFQPLLLELIQLLIAKQDVEAKMMHTEEEFSNYLLHGMDRDTMHAKLYSIFQFADTDQSGSLDRKEFQIALKSADLGLTRKEINGLLHAVDENDEGNITYADFAPIAFDLCVGIYARQIAHESLPSGEKELNQYFEQLFQSADVDGSGRLAAYQLGDLLFASDIGLSKIQIHAVLGEATKDEQGTVNYMHFATTAATVRRCFFLIRLRVLLCCIIVDTTLVFFVFCLRFSSLLLDGGNIVKFRRTSCHIGISTRIGRGYNQWNE